MVTICHCEECFSLFIQLHASAFSIQLYWRASLRAGSFIKKDKQASEFRDIFRSGKTLFTFSDSPFHPSLERKELSTAAAVVSQLAALRAAQPTAKLPLRRATRRRPRRTCPRMKPLSDDALMHC